MERSLKILGRVLLLVLGLLVIKSILQYVDYRYFEGFWSYFITYPSTVSNHQ